MDLNSAVNELAIALTNTQEFLELKKSRSELSKNPAYAKMLDEFQKKQTMLYNQNLPQNQAQALMEQIDADYRTLSGIAEISRYFIASDRFNDLIGRTMNMVTGYVEKAL